MEKVNSLDLSIIIVSYKSKDHLEVLMPSVFESRGVNFDVVQASGLPQKQAGGLHYSAEIIVVDNGSNDGTIEYLESAVTHFDGRQNVLLNLKLIKNVNNGFAAGNNIAIKQSRGRYILLLNPDTKLEPDTLQTMLDFMEAHQEVGISGCKIVKPDGKLDLACRRRFPNPWSSFKRLFLLNRKDYNYTDINEDQEMEVDSVVGAFLLIRKSVVDKIGMLDESFFMYGEDLDWAFRCKEVGFKVWYFPKTVITHYKGSSSAKAPFKSLRWFHDAMWIFYKKHYFPQYPKAFSLLVWYGIYLRFCILAAVNIFKSNPRVSK